MGTTQKVNSHLSSWISVFEDVVYVVFFSLLKLITVSTPNSTGGFMD